MCLYEGTTALMNGNVDLSLTRWASVFLSQVSRLSIKSRRGGLVRFHARAELPLLLQVLPFSPNELFRYYEPTQRIQKGPPFSSLFVIWEEWRATIVVS